MSTEQPFDPAALLRAAVEPFTQKMQQSWWKDAQLHDLLASAFFASLHTEEGRGVQVTLVHMPPGTAPKYSSPLESSLPACANTVRRLAPAIHPIETALWTTSTPEGPQVQGFCHRPLPTIVGPFESESIAVISIRGPGRISFSGERARSAYVCGQYIGLPAYESLGELVDGIDRGQLLREALKDPHVEELRRKPELAASLADGSLEAFVDLKAQSIVRVYVALLLDEIHRLGHGCTLLVVPPDAISALGGVLDQKKSPLMPARAQVASWNDGVVGWLQVRTVMLADSVHALQKHEHLMRRDARAADRLVRQVRSIAALTQVDGAVILGTDFAPWAFGAFFDGQPSQQQGAGSLEAGLHNERRGTRHTTAVRALERLPSGLAIIVSSDGEVTAVSRSSDAPVTALKVYV